MVKEEERVSRERRETRETRERRQQKGTCISCTVHVCPV